MQDRTRVGRKFRMLTVIDEFTRECLAIGVARRLNSQSVLAVLAYTMVRRGVPEYIRSDNVLCGRELGKRGQEISPRRSFPARLAA